MKKRLYLHIGTYKTGSTSMQAWLAENRDALKEQGVLYPDILGKGVYRRQLAIELTEKGRGPVWQSVVKEIERSGCATVVLSSEYFWSTPFMKPLSPRERIELVQRCFSDFSVNIIVYLRNPADYYISHYKELIKGRVKWHKSFGEYIARIPDQCQYLRILRLWGSVFGRDAVLVSVYDQAKQNGRLIEHFLKGINVEVAQVNWKNPEIKNKALPSETLRAIRVCNKMEQKMPSGLLLPNAINLFRRILKRSDLPGMRLVAETVSKFDAQDWLPEADLQSLCSKVSSWPDQLAADGWIADGQVYFLRVDQSRAVSNQ